MSRSGYVEDEAYPGQFAMWRGLIASATRGRRGQRFFRDLLSALDEMTAKRLVSARFEAVGDVCALGALGRRRGANLEELFRAADNEDFAALGSEFDIAEQLAREVMFINDEDGPYQGETPEQRWERVRAWAAEQIRETR